MSDRVIHWLLSDNGDFTLFVVFAIVIVVGAAFEIASVFRSARDGDN